MDFLLLIGMAKDILLLYAYNSNLFELTQTNPTFVCMRPFACIKPRCMHHWWIHTEIRRNALEWSVYSYGCSDKLHLVLSLGWSWSQLGQLMDDFKTSKYGYRLVNYITRSVGDNVFSKSGIGKSLGSCSNNTLAYPYNPVNLDVLDSSLVFLHCGFDPGNTYLTNITYNRCFITGWSENYFSNLPL